MQTASGKEFNFDESIELALRTWYPKDHELHFNPHHPLGKLVGEWGELLDDYMKSIYKPGYVFEPLDELGDIWYYLRVLCYQRNHKPIDFNMSSNEPDHLISSVLIEASIAFCNLTTIPSSEYLIFLLDVCYSAIIRICELYNITLQQLTNSNWEKFKPGSIRGNEWMKAREDTDYVGGKVAKR